MTKREEVFNLHITVDPEKFEGIRLGTPWKVLNIQNVQGAPHCIVSCKYSGDSPMSTMRNMAQGLEKMGARVLREKIEFHFQDPSYARRSSWPLGVVEIHYKYKRRGMFPVGIRRIEELDERKLALSFNEGSQRVILSARFANVNAYKMGGALGKLPAFLEDEEREIVVFDTNAKMDSFWPLRNEYDTALSFDSFPYWIPTQ